MTLIDGLTSQGLTDTDDLADLDEDDVRQIFKLIKSLGGTVPNPAYPGPAAGGRGRGGRGGRGQAAGGYYIPPTIPEEGVKVQYVQI